MMLIIDWSITQRDVIPDKRIKVKLLTYVWSDQLTGSVIYIDGY